MFRHESVEAVVSLKKNGPMPLLEAASLDQLRERFCRLAAHYGFTTVSERTEPILRDDRKSLDYEIVWGNFEQRYGASADGIVRGVHETLNNQELEEVNERQRWIAAQRAPFLLQAQAPKLFQISRRRARVPVAFGEPQVRDTLMVPVGTRGSKVGHLVLPTETPPSLRDTAAGVSLASIYRLVARSLEAQDEPLTRPDRGSDKAVELTLKQLTVLRWAAAGKTLGEIAALTGFSYRTVRYHLDAARMSYGYATVQQTIVRAALDYGLDPLGR